MPLAQPPDLAALWRAFLIASRFLTRAPLPDPGRDAELSGADYGRAALFYPVVGLLLGSLLALLALLLQGSPAPLSAFLILLLWVWGTGALHLDGLADCADAWVGGLGDRSRTLTILKDPHIGAMGVVALIMGMLGKWSALWVLADGVGTEGTGIAALVWTPALARMQILALALTTPAASPSGMGAALKTCLPGRAAWALILFGWLVASVWFGELWFALISAAVVCLLSWRASVRNRLGGFTGDTAGALVEMTEIALLVMAVAPSLLVNQS